MEQLEESLYPWVAFAVLPLFAFATPACRCKGVPGLVLRVLGDGLRKRPLVRRYSTAGAMRGREGSGSAWVAWNVTSASPRWLAVSTLAISA
jgi:hypothetical protein